VNHIDFNIFTGQKLFERKAIFVYFLARDNLQLANIYHLSFVITYIWMMTVYGLFDMTDNNL